MHFERLLNIAKQLKVESHERTLASQDSWWQAQIVRQGPNDWNYWRRANPKVKLDLCHKVLTDLRLDGADFSECNLSSVNFLGTFLSGANFNAANLQAANLSECDLKHASFRRADVSGANFYGAELDGADLTEAIGLTSDQIQCTDSSADTKLPSGVTKPSNRS